MIYFGYGRARKVVELFGSEEERGEADAYGLCELNQKFEVGIKLASSRAASCVGVIPAPAAMSLALKPCCSRISPMALPRLSSACRSCICAVLPSRARSVRAYLGVVTSDTCLLRNLRILLGPMPSGRRSMGACCSRVLLHIGGRISLSPVCLRHSRSRSSERECGALLGYGNSSCVCVSVTR